MKYLLTLTIILFIFETTAKKMPFLEFRGKIYNEVNKDGSFKYTLELEENRKKKDIVYNNIILTSTIENDPFLKGFNIGFREGYIKGWEDGYIQLINKKKEILVKKSKGD